MDTTAAGRSGMFARRADTIGVGDEPLQVKVVLRTPGTALIRLAGELDATTSEQVRAVVDGVLSEPAAATVEVEARGLTFLDSSGIRCLLGCRKRAVAAGSRLLVVDPSLTAREALDITGLLDLFGVTPGQAEPPAATYRPTPAQAGADDARAPTPRGRADDGRPRAAPAGAGDSRETAPLGSAGDSRETAPLGSAGNSRVTAPLGSAGDSRETAPLGSADGGRESVLLGGAGEGRAAASLDGPGDQQDAGASTAVGSRGMHRAQSTEEVIRQAAGLRRSAREARESAEALRTRTVLRPSDGRAHP